MRRMMLAILLLTLLLAGCAIPEPVPPVSTGGTTAPTTVSTQPTQTVATLPGLRVEQSAVESETSGAVREYALPEGQCVAVRAMGEDLLLITAGETVTLTRVTGAELNPTAVRSVAALELEGLLIQEDAVGYYDAERRSVVFLDEFLEETSCFAMPEDMVGVPVIAPDRGSVYYTTESDLRVLDLKTGISRLLKQTQYAAVGLIELYLDGTVLLMVGTDEDGTQTGVFLSAQTGETAYVMEEPLDFSIYGDRTFLRRMDGSVQQLLYGQVGGSLRCLIPAEESCTPVPLLSRNGCVTVTADGNDTTLSCYDLTTGYRTAEVALPGIVEVDAFTAAGERIFFLGTSEEGTALYGWEPDLSPTREQLDHTGDVCTRECPDTAGLENCAAWAKRLSGKYDIDLRIWEDALVDVAEVTLESEYQVSAYRRDLAALEAVLAQFPTGFFKTAADGTNSGVLHVCLVRSIAGSAETLTGRAQGLQLWLDGEAYIFLTMGDDLVETFLHELSHVIDNRVFGTCVLFDHWEDLNPGSFAYDYDYAANQQRDGSAYLEDETRAFIDTYSMSYPKEDRAAIFACAMGEGNESYFGSDTMQKKLRQLCLGIREAFGYEKLQQALPWEQYLEAPLYTE